MYHLDTVLCTFYPATALKLLILSHFAQQWSFSRCIEFSLSWFWPVTLLINDLNFSSTGLTDSQSPPAMDVCVERQVLKIILYLLKTCCLFHIHQAPIEAVCALNMAVNGQKEAQRKTFTDGRCSVCSNCSSNI